MYCLMQTDEGSMTRIWRADWKVHERRPVRLSSSESMGPARFLRWTSIIEEAGKKQPHVI